jgi:hypothetical protein
VSWGISGLFGGRRVVAPLGARLPAESLIEPSSPFNFVETFAVDAFFAVGFLAVVFFTVAFLQLFF